MNERSHDTGDDDNDPSTITTQSVNDRIVAANVDTAVQVGNIYGSVNIYTKAGTASQEKLRRPPAAKVRIERDDRADENRLATLMSHAKEVKSLAISPDGEVLAVAGSNARITNDDTVQLWNIVNTNQAALMGEPLVTDDPFSIISVAFNPSGRALAVAGYDDRKLGAVLLWDITDPQEPVVAASPVVGGPGQSPRAVFGPCGHVLAIANLGHITLWDVRDIAKPVRIGQVATPKPDDSIYGLTFSPDGHILAAWTLRDGFLLWNITDHARPSFIGRFHLTGYKCIIDSVSFSTDGKILAVSGGDGVPVGHIWLWDMNEQSSPVRFGRHMVSKNCSVRAAQFNSDGCTLITVDGDVTLWDTTHPNRPGPLHHTSNIGVPGQYASRMAYSRINGILAVSGTNGNVGLWNIDHLIESARKVIGSRN